MRCASLRQSRAGDLLLWPLGRQPAVPLQDGSDDGRIGNSFDLREALDKEKKMNRWRQLRLVASREKMAASCRYGLIGAVQCKHMPPNSHFPCSSIEADKAGNLMEDMVDYYLVRFECSTSNFGQAKNREVDA
ncbi:hypothetical protein Cni_G28359 [Canna indica]|uniref:Uncharacterized protein n=1 Tax=Canna indica TaxID=4628 RepID=A0AAQ3L2E7_9LILI|nr:hypothetical protein Cni_G28359 [Canna indica]